MSTEATGRRSPRCPAIIPYLTVAAARPLIAFLEAAFGAETLFLAPTEQGGVMHAEIKLGDSLLMLSDAPPTPQGPTNLCHYVPDTDATYAAALAAGATTLRPPETQHYGDRLAGIMDPAGNNWWICTRPAP
jgi:uncharacterized glyoxalase superfamily protein PhnB